MIAFVNFFKKYIELNLKDYSLGIDLEINKIILFVAIGISAACFFINMRQGAIATLLKKLIRSGAFGEENAVSLKTLGLDKNSSVKRLISKKEGYLKRIIKRVGEKEITYEEYMESVRSKKKNGEKSAPVSENTEENAKNSSKSGDVVPPEHKGTDTIEDEEAADSHATEEAVAAISSESAERPICNSAAVGADTAEESSIDSEHENAAERSVDAERRVDTEHGVDAVDDGLYYIPAEEKDFALRTLEKNNASVIKAILMSALVLGFSFAAILVMPSLLSLFNG